MKEFKIRVEGDADAIIINRIRDVLVNDGYDITYINNSGDEYLLVEVKPPKRVLKHIELGRCENLSQEIREQFGLSENGAVFIETIREGDNLILNYVDCNKIGGVMGYLSSKGDFEEVDF